MNTEIQWQDWTSAVFERAQRERKAILLDITATWCHWCQVMEHSAYADPEAVATINRDFVPVRVDTDKFPDINERYNMGGWPSTVFLTWRGDVITGATYLAPTQLKQVLRQVAELYRKRPDEVLKLAEHSGREVRGIFYRAPEEAARLDMEIVDYQYQYLRQVFDDTHGGFGTEPKFPQPSALEFLLAHYYYNQDIPSRQMLALTLRLMSERGIFDRQEGGFFRYSAGRDWNSPHYEKLLEDNANLIRLYLHAYVLLGEDKYAETAVQTLEYVEAYLTAGERGFFASQAAKEEYYRLPLAQRLEKQSPQVDTSIYVNGNAAMVSAYLLATAVLGKPGYETYALSTLDMLLRDYAHPGGGFIHHREQAGRPLLLADQVNMLAALTEAYQFTGNPVYREQAEQLIEAIEELFFDPEVSALLDREHRQDEPGRLGYKYIPMADNSQAARLFIQWGHISGDPHYRELAEEILAYFSGAYQKYAAQSAEYPLAVYAYLSTPVVISINKAADDTGKLLHLSRRAYVPDKVIAHVEQGPPASVCLGRTCWPPVLTLLELMQTLERARESSKPPVPLL